MSLFVMDQVLKLGNITFKYIADVTVSSGLYEPVDTMTIKLPLKKGFDREKIKINQEVVWKAGYTKHGFFTEFVGNITEISPKTSENKPLEIVCKDKMYSAQVTLMDKNISYKSLSDTLSIVTGKLGMSADTIRLFPKTIGAKKISSLCHRKSIRWFLTDLKRYGYFAFFRNNKLHCISPTEYDEADYKAPSDFKIGFNIIEDKLINRIEGDVQVIVQSYNDKTGKVIEAKYPDKNKGQTKEYQIDGLSQSEALKRAKDLFKEIAGYGMRGSFSTFGFPNVYHSEIINIIDPFNTERNKQVFVGKVVKTFNAERAQYRQEIFPEIIDFTANKKKKKKR